MCIFYINRIRKMPPRNGPSGISRAITPEQERLLEETWSNTQTPTQDELVLVQRQSGLSAAKVYFILIYIAI